MKKAISNKRVIPAILGILALGLVLASTRIPTQSRNTQPLEFDPSKTIKITVICPQTSELEEYALLVKLAEEDINKYMKESGLEFDFILLDAQGQSKNAFELAYASYNQGYELIVGLSWSSQMDTFVSFAQENGALIISPGSAQPWPWKLAPNTYRLNPADHLYSIPIASAVKNLNITNIVILKQGEHYSNPIIEQFESEYSGSVQTVSLGYNLDLVEINETVSSLLNKVNEACENVGPDHVGVYFIGFSSELCKITERYSQDTKYEIPWFVSEWYGWNGDVGRNSGDFNETLHLLGEIKLIGVFPVKPNNQAYTRINKIYSNLTGVSLSLVHGNVYDGLWITALSIAEVESIEGDEVGQVVPIIVRSYFGVTGNCSFNEWGDRWGVDWTLYGYQNMDNKTKVISYGFFNSSSSEIEWIIDPQ